MATDPNAAACEKIGLCPGCRKIKAPEIVDSTVSIVGYERTESVALHYCPECRAEFVKGLPRKAA